MSYAVTLRLLLIMGSNDRRFSTAKPTLSTHRLGRPEVALTRSASRCLQSLAASSFQCEREKICGPLIRARRESQQFGQGRWLSSPPLRGTRKCNVQSFAWKRRAENRGPQTRSISTAELNRDQRRVGCGAATSVEQVRTMQ
jgi:hypothetical protein